jgi:hypothetical protein
VRPIRNRSCERAFPIFVAARAARFESPAARGLLHHAKNLRSQATCRRWRLTKLRLPPLAFNETPSIPCVSHERNWSHRMPTYETAETAETRELILQLNDL